MLRKIRMTILALGAAACVGAAAGGQALAEADYLRLRPLKEPSPCAEAKNGAKCPEAPRINKRRSTIPGIQKPDYGRPPVNSNPLGRGATPQLRIFGNPAISGR
jgi:hypothetical protein